MKLQYDASVKTPFAHFALLLENDQLVKIDFISQTIKPIAAKSASAKNMVQQIQQYFSGNSQTFKIELNMQGTVFQKSVWRELLKVRYGKVKTYGEVAARLKTSPRAVGNACRQNPVPLIVPCHRIVAASGIGGYSGTTSGPVHSIKFELLAHEGVTTV